MAVSPCDVLNTLTQYQLDVLTQLNKRIAALRQLAQLLEQLGDAAAAFVNDLNNFVDHLVPVVDIDFNVYLQLASACPFLNLPSVAAGGSVGTAALQAMVTAAYNNMVHKLLNHPYSRMNFLQNEMNMYADKFANAVAVAAGFAQCLQAACNGTLFTGKGSAAVNAQVDQYQQNFVVDGGNVLSPAGQAKSAQVRALIGRMQTLGATTGTTYAAAKAKLTAAQTVAV